MKLRNSIVLVFVLAALLLPAAARVPAQGSALTITYVANEGFLIATGGRAVLVDALFRPGPGAGSAARPGDALIARMTQGAPPFARVDALLVSHDHHDHLDPALVQAFLARHPETTLVSTGAICATVAAAGGPAARMRRIKIELGASTVESVAGMSVKAAGVRHQGDRPLFPFLPTACAGTVTENLAWLVTIEGRKILHVGDAPADLNVKTYRSLGLPAERIDVLFLECFDFSDASAAFVKNELKPRHIVAMHVPATGGERDLAKFRRTYPNAIVFTKSLEARTLN